MSYFKNIKKRLCTECGKTKPIEEFRKINYGNHLRTCKACETEKKLKKKYDKTL